MKKINFAVLVGAALSLSFASISCSSSPKVERISANTVVDLSGYWNDTDVRTVAETLINDCMNAGAIRNFEQKKNRVPVVVVGEFRNQSDEHIDTSILAKKFEVALINSGKVDFVASSSERSEIRAERDDQQINASEETAASIGNETGADFMLVGSVKTIVDSIGNQSVRTYFVSAEMVDIETNRKLWAGTDDSIKKYIKKSSVRK